MNENSKEDFMLTTFDNPFNPFTEFEAWWKEDLLLGHDCCGLLEKLSFVSERFGDERNEELIDEAMDYICGLAPTIYRKVTKEDFKEQPIVQG